MTDFLPDVMEGVDIICVQVVVDGSDKSYLQWINNCQSILTFVGAYRATASTILIKRIMDLVKKLEN